MGLPASLLCSGLRSDAFGSGAIAPTVIARLIALGLPSFVLALAAYRAVAQGRSAGVSAGSWFTIGGPAVVSFGPAFLAFCAAILSFGTLRGGQVTASFAVAPIMTAILPGMARTKFRTLMRPMLPMMALHRIARTTPIKNIDAIAGIIKIVVPAAAKSDIGIAIAIVAGIIIIKGRIGVAGIARPIDIAVTISAAIGAGAKA